MTIQEIKNAVDNGYKVFWSTRSYQVIKDSLGQYLIQCTLNGHCISLTDLTGKRLNGEEDQFFILETNKNVKNEACVLTIQTIGEALKSDFWLEPEKQRIISEAAKLGFIRTFSVTQAEWSEDALRALALEELRFLYSDKQLLGELHKRGYSTSTLWHLNDVRNAVDEINSEWGTNYSLPRVESMGILENLFGANSDTSALLEMLSNTVRERLADLYRQKEKPDSV